MPRTSRVAGVPAVLTLLALLAGCSGPDGRSPEDTAVSFVRAVQSGDGDSACRMLTEQAAESVTGATQEECADVVVSLEPESTGSGTPPHVQGVQLWGDAAQVKVGDDVVFLLRSHDGWKVDAAGCSPRASGPYECEIGR